jgi:hypothetical protein
VASWQLFGNGELSEWKVQAATTRVIYIQDLERYRQTTEYKEHQRYLVDFKLKDSSSHPLLNGRSASRRSSNPTDGDPEGSASLEGWLPPTNPSAFPYIQTQEDINSSATTWQTKSNKCDSIDDCSAANLEYNTIALGTEDVALASRTYYNDEWVY